MKTFKTIAAISTSMTLVLSGCATPGQPGSTENKAANIGGGAVIGCLGGALVAHLAGGKAAKGCAIGAAIGGMTGYAKARQEEIDAAKNVQAETLAAVPGAKAEPVVTESVEVKDKSSGETKTIQAVKEVTIDMPLSQKGTPQFNSAMDKIKALAERYADERQSADLTVAMNQKEARQRKVSSMTTALKTTSGKGTINFARTIDSAVPAGFERITVRAANSQKVDA